MPSRSRYAGLTLVLAFTATASTATACSCGEPPSGLKGDGFVQWKRDKAETILRGKIVSLRAGEGVSILEGRVVAAEMDVEAVEKGSLTTAGRVQLATGFGVGDCGISDWMLAAIAWRRTVNLEVHASPELPGVFIATMCGYSEMDSMSGRKR